jgi:LmbE family N-acetylglucosaminyl deacetylase
MTTHLFLSPHLDDAVLSCGGTIGQLTEDGNPVWVLTLFAGDPVHPYSRVARLLHELWGTPPEPVRLRRAEDAAATARLGSHSSYEDIPDAIYRRDRDGAWSYTRRESLLQGVHPDDEWIPRYLAGRVQAAAQTDWPIYAPLGVGGHVDHRLTFEAAQLLATSGYQVSFYEDFPYVFRKQRYRQRVAELAGWTPTVVRFDERLLLAKIDAFGYYRSQIAMLFPGAESIEAPFRAWAAQVTGSPADWGERYWHPPAQTTP